MKYVNEAGWDRILRVIVGVILMILGFGNTLAGTLGLVAGIIGVVLLVTGLTGFCLIYKLFNIRTNK